ncbi:hypothetical protein CC80DRAFT_501319 [Byssothecium circinans]|uniref:Uncharacterized protein n=1 Tax=Byssothecium circinans TaxID=147558 RepID=A0A6A5U7S4_9PLEO|nr:hypothetical protein CC80DRAFT_501319 [Byssothecium circinans]
MLPPRAGVLDEEVVQVVRETEACELCTIVYELEFNAGNTVEVFREYDNINCFPVLGVRKDFELDIARQLQHFFLPQPIEGIESLKVFLPILLVQATNMSLPREFCDTIYRYVSGNKPPERATIFRFSTATDIRRAVAQISMRDCDELGKVELRSLLLSRHPIRLCIGDISVFVEAFALLSGRIEDWDYHLITYWSDFKSNKIKYVDVLALLNAATPAL